MSSARASFCPSRGQESDCPGQPAAKRGDFFVGSSTRVLADSAPAVDTRTNAPIAGDSPPCLAVSRQAGPGEGEPDGYLSK